MGTQARNWCPDLDTTFWCFPEFGTPLKICWPGFAHQFQGVSKVGSAPNNDFHDLDTNVWRCLRFSLSLTSKTSSSWCLDLAHQFLAGMSPPSETTFRNWCQDPYINFWWSPHLRTAPRNWCLGS